MQQLALDLFPPEIEEEEDLSQIVNDYPPSHCWYYKLGGRILDVGEIPARAYFDHIETKPVAALEAVEKELAEDIAHYHALVNGTHDWSSYDLDVCYHSDKKWATDCSLSMTYNHISYHRGQVAALRFLTLALIS